MPGGTVVQELVIIHHQSLIAGSDRDLRPRRVGHHPVTVAGKDVERRRLVDRANAADRDAAHNLLVLVGRTENDGLHARGTGRGLARHIDRERHHLRRSPARPVAVNRDGLLDGERAGRDIAADQRILHDKAGRTVMDRQALALGIGRGPGAVQRSAGVQRRKLGDRAERTDRNVRGRGLKIIATAEIDGPWSFPACMKSARGTRRRTAAPARARWGRRSCRPSACRSSGAHYAPEDWRFRSG